MCRILVCCCVIIGIVGNGEYLLVFLGKVGRSRYLGVCLIVCGFVMNLIDYLYGGGEGK